MRNAIPRACVVHDISGLGRTSLTAVIPILSSMGIQPVPLPTAVLSTQTVGTEGFTLCDLTANMGPVLDHWERLGEKFECVYSGFMACPAQMDYVARAVEKLLAEDGLAVVDPVLGDDGALFPTMTQEMVGKMRWLIGQASVITPNYTEMCLLLDEPCGACTEERHLKDCLKELAGRGPEVVVGTSMPLARNERGELQYASVLAYERRVDAFWRIDCSYVPVHYPGTGDIFASVLTGCLLAGESVSVALDKAEQFCTLLVRATFGQDLPAWQGVVLERYLSSLRKPLLTLRCRLEST